MPDYLTQDDNNNSPELENTQADTAEMNPEQFNMVLMSFIHDIKNSLLMSLSSLEELYITLDDAETRQKDNVAKIQYELRRINNSLVQLLSLYKMETHLFSMHADQYNLYDFLDDLIINNTPLNTNQDFSIELDCDESIEWFFDRDLIASIINSTMNNSIRYAQSKILLSARIRNDYLEINLEDDGRGFPEKMFANPDTLETAINMKSGSTGLGLYFAEKIANIHHNGEKRGTTLIDNESSIGGGRFILRLP